MQFSVVRGGAGPRIATLVIQEIDQVLQTPCPLLYTKAGGVPNLSWDLVHLIPGVTRLAIAPINLLLEHHQAIGNSGRSLAQFIGFQKGAVLVSLYDPLAPPSTGYNEQKSVAVWTRSGKSLLTNSRYLAAVDSMSPLGFQVLCDADTPASAQKKRLQKSYRRSSELLDETIQLRNECKKNAVFASLIGGFSATERKRFASSISHKEVDGFVLDNLVSCQGTDWNCIRELVSASTEPLPKDKPRLLPGPLGLRHVIEAVQIGVDLFDTSYVHQLTAAKTVLITNWTSEGAGQRVVLMDLSEVKWQADTTPVMEACPCYTCRNYTKAYLRHLVNTDELLGSTLIAMHNLFQYLDFFAHLRKELEADRLDKLLSELDAIQDSGNTTSTLSMCSMTQ